MGICGQPLLVWCSVVRLGRWLTRQPSLVYFRIQADVPVLPSVQQDHHDNSIDKLPRLQVSIMDVPKYVRALYSWSGEEKCEYEA